MRVLLLCFLGNVAARLTYPAGYDFGSFPPTEADDVDDPAMPSTDVTKKADRFIGLDDGLQPPPIDKGSGVATIIDHGMVDVPKCVAGCKIWSNDCEVCNCDGFGFQTKPCKPLQFPMRTSCGPGVCQIWNGTVPDVPTPCPEDCPTAFNTNSGTDECICTGHSVWNSTLCQCVNTCAEDDEVPEECDKPIDIAFIIDASGSVGSDYAPMLHEVGKIVRGLDISEHKVHVAARSFSCQTCHLQAGAGFYFDENVYGDTNVEARINNLPFHDSSTWTGSAVKHTEQEVLSGLRGSRVGQTPNSGTPGALIIVTDGSPNGQSVDGMTQANLAAYHAAEARARGIKTYAIGVGGYGASGTHWSQLEEMACGPGITNCGRVWGTANFDVSQFKRELLEGLCADDVPVPILPDIPIVGPAQPIPPGTPATFITMQQKKCNDPTNLVGEAAVQGESLPEQTHLHVQYNGAPPFYWNGANCVAVTAATYDPEYVFTSQQLCNLLCHVQ